MNRRERDRDRGESRAGWSQSSTDLSLIVAVCLSNASLKSVYSMIFTAHDVGIVIIICSLLTLPPLV